MSPILATTRPMHAARLLGGVLAAGLLLAPAAAGAATLFEDDFEDGALSPWSVVGGNPNNAEVNGDTSQSGTQSMAIGPGGPQPVNVESPVVDTSGPDAELELWIRRGDNSFSNQPEPGEDLEVYYIDDTGSRVLLDTFPGGGTGGEVFTPSYSLPADARHPNFRVVLVLTPTNRFDFWHVDDVTVTQGEAAFVGSGTGLTGAYCNRAAFDGNQVDPAPCDANPDVTRVDATVDFSNGDADWPAAGIGGDHFTVRWTGQVQAQYTEDYTFHALHDDGVRVWVDGTQVIDNYVNQDDAWTDAATTVSLQRGQRYDIVVEYYEDQGQEDITLAWSSPSTPLRTTIPQTQLYPDATGGGPGGLLVAYRMDESAWDGTAGEVADATGNGRAATAEGDATTAGATPAIPGDPGTCRYGTLDGDGDYVLDGDAGNYLNGLTAVTFTAWVRNTAATPVDAGIFNTGPTQGQDNNLGLRYDAAGASTGNSANLKASLNTDQCASGSDCIQVETESGLQVQDQWQHVAMTWTSGEPIRIYIDGQEVQTTVVAGAGNLGGTLDDVAFLRLGQSSKGGEDWQGWIDEVRLYDEALSEAEIADVRDATHPCTAPPVGGGCPAVFPSAVQNTDPAGSITFEFDTSVVDPDNQLETTQLVDNSGGTNSCGSADCTGVTPVATAANVPPFENATGNNDAQTTFFDSTFALGEDGESDYDVVDIGFQDTLEDTGAFSTYRIDELRLGFRATWNVAGGTDYFVRDASISSQTDINVTGSGTARIFVRDPVDFQNNVEVNTGGRPDQLLIVGYDTVSFSTGGGGGVNALVYSQADVTLGNQVEIEGAVAAAGAVTLGSSGSRVQYDDQAIDDVDDRGLCPAPQASTEYAIAHPGTAVTCTATPVTITARDGSGQPKDPGNVTLALSTDTGEGTWARVLSGSGTLTDATAGDGAASYTFPGNGETSVELALNYTTVSPGEDPENVNLDVQDGNGNTEVGSADPDLTVSRSGLRITDGSGSPVTIANQIAGKPTDAAPGAQTLGLQAVRAADNDPSVCEPAFPGGQDVEVELGAECRDPSTCAGRAMRVTNNGNTTAIATGDDNGDAGAPAYTTVSLRFGANAEAPIVLDYADAGSMQLHARYNPIETGAADPPVVAYVSGASNVHPWRPFGFHVRATGGNPGASGPGGGIYTSAGTDFGVAVAAVGWASGDDDNPADGVPDGYGNGDPTDNADLSDNVVLPNFGPESTNESVALSAVLWQPTGSGTQDPGLAGTTTIGEAAFEDAANAGLGAGSTTVRYGEVGIIELRAELADGAYQGAGDVRGRSGPVGRFIPADFAQTVADDGVLGNACNNVHSYVGQAFGYATAPALTITARNAAGATTRNYTGGFARLDAGEIARTAPTQDNARNGTDGTRLEVDATLAQGQLTGGNGVFTYTFSGNDEYAFVRDLDRNADGAIDTRVAPFTSDLTVAIDGINETEDGVTAAATADVEPDGGRIRFGRLRIDNAAGSEIAPVGQPVRAEFWNGDTWVLNTDDGCTALTLGGAGNEVQLADDSGNTVAGDEAVTVGSGTSTIVEGSPVALAGGTATFTFEAPGAGNVGWLESELLLTGNEHPYLRTDPEDDGTWQTDPAGRVTFGIYDGDDAWIHLRRVPTQ